jgi:sorting nexin-25
VRRNGWFEIDGCVWSQFVVQFDKVICNVTFNFHRLIERGTGACSTDAGVGLDARQEGRSRRIGQERRSIATGLNMPEALRGWTQRQWATAATASIALFLSLLLVSGLSTFQLILLFPSFLALIIVLGVSVLLYLVYRADRDVPRSDLLARQRHALRRLAFATPQRWSALLELYQRQTTGAITGSNEAWRTPIHGLEQPDLSTKLDQLFTLIRRHFILPWYERISPTPALPNAVEVLIRQSVSGISKRAEKVDWASFTVSKLVPLVTDHLHHFRSVEHLATAPNTSINSTPTNPVLPLPLPKGHHRALTTQSHLSSDTFSPTIESHLRVMISKMLKEVLPKEDQTDVVHTIIQEVVLGSVVSSVFEILCDGDSWNRQIDERGGRYLHEQ